jgi:hypothetical protein
MKLRRLILATDYTEQILPSNPDLVFPDRKNLSPSTVVSGIVTTAVLRSIPFK